MKKFMVSVLLVLSVASWANANTTFKLWLEADEVTSGDYNVQIYCQLVGLNPAAGETLSTMAINIWTPDSVGVTQPKTYRITGSDNNWVTTTWNPTFTTSNWMSINAVGYNYYRDGDQDAYELCLGTPYFSKPGLDMTTNPILIATETWTMLKTPTAPFTLEVGADSNSEFWTTDGSRSKGSAMLGPDGIQPDGSGNSFQAVFDNYQYTGITLGVVPEPLTMVAVMMGLAGLGRYVRSRVRR